MTFKLPTEMLVSGVTMVGVVVDGVFWTVVTMVADRVIGVGLVVEVVVVDGGIEMVAGVTKVLMVDR